MSYSKSSDIVVIVPSGKSNSQAHFTFRGDYLTFCGRNCEKWETADTPVSFVIDNAACCKRCRLAYYG